MRRYCCCKWKRIDRCCPDALLLGVKVLNAGGAGSSDAIIAGIEFSLDPDGNPNTNDGANVISMSLGGWGNPEDSSSIATNNAVVML